jgi:capsule biosynthesis phosphatase
MIIIIPLGGIGDRFKQNGYKQPKGLIKLFGKPILYYLLDNLNTTDIDFVCIPYNKEYSQYNFEEQLTKDYPNIQFRFFKLANNTEGAAHTINIALNTFSYLEDKPILCLDGDNFYTIDIIKLWNGENKIITFEDLNEQEIYSYLKIENEQVKNIVEKQKISNHACTGAYGFRSYKQLLEYTKKILDNQIKQKGEYYTSTVIREMIKDNISFLYHEIDENNYHCLGTPTQVKFFYNNFPKISCLTNKENFKILRICFDLDNTLVSFPKIKNDYTSVEPISKNISFLRYLKSFGHTIIIYTARRMNTHKGNVGKVLCDIGKITFDTLDKFNIPFDEIYFGKPLADVYIDDLALNCYDNIEKELGFYMDIVEPRDFNQLSQNTMNTVIKKSKDLSGEIFYYTNIPKSLKDLFPLLIDYDVNNKWLKIEKIKSLTVTNLYLSELLKEETLIHIMNSIKRIHDSTSVVEIKNDINIYENYCTKIKNRYENYDYSRFKDSEELFTNLMNLLSEYEKNNRGHQTIIHGDTVMTNILINNLGKIKFIDMRGKIGNTLTIYGDALYDWAKLYQSLIGYDKILQDKVINTEYEQKMIKVFEDYFLKLYSPEHFQDLKLITKSLLFTLIPLHNNEKCQKYYELI